jgi:hypothetical protein
MTDRLDLYGQVKERLWFINKLTKEQAEDAMDKIGYQYCGEHFSAGCYDVKQYAYDIADRYREEYLKQSV